MESDNYEVAKRVITGAKRILISGHISPDGDSLGCMIALTKLLRLEGHDAYAAADLKSIGKLSFLDGVKDIITLRALKKSRQKFDLFIAVDCNALNRIPAEVQAIIKDVPKLCFDHHVTNAGNFADVMIVNPAASSTGEIIWRFAKWNNWRLNHEIAEALWVALTTDSGRFAYESTSTDTLLAASDLLKYEVRTALINDIIYAAFSRKAIALKRRAWQNLRIWKNRKIAEVWLSREDFRNVKGTKSDAEDIIEIPRQVSGNEIAIFYYEIPDRTKETRCSIRTRGKWDATKIASAFGGGGHIRAAGCTINAPIRKARGMVRAVIKEMLKNG